jgi:hypothetical protein
MFSSKVNLEVKLKLFVGMVPLKVHFKAKFLNDFVGMVRSKVNLKAKFPNDFCRNGFVKS